MNNETKDLILSVVQGCAFPWMGFVVLMAGKNDSNSAGSVLLNLCFFAGRDDLVMPLSEVDSVDERWRWLLSEQR
jgi:hypothetical protein